MACFQMLLIRHNIAVKRSFNSSLICYLALALLNPVIHCHQIPNLGAMGSNPVGDAIFAHAAAIGWLG